MDVHQKLDEIVEAVRGARGMPMSASCVLNRADLLAGLEEVREALPDSLAEAREVLGGRERVVADAQQEARRILQAAHEERGSLVGETEIVQQARAEAARLLGEARTEAAEVRVEADDYVDSKLANFEVVLGKTIASVDRGRDKLLGPDRAAPEELLREADAYVEAQFAAIETVLRKTLEAVGRGREKLSGRRPIDDLAERPGGDEGVGEYGPGEYADLRADAPAADYADPHPGGRDGQHGHPGQESGERDGYGYPPSPPPAPHALPAPSAPHAPPAPPALPAVPTASADPYAYQQQGYDGYPADPYAAAGYPQESYGQAGYGYDYGQQPSHAPQQQPGYPSSGAVLDETSLFDTGLIDAEHLRRYQQGSG